MPSRPDISSKFGAELDATVKAMTAKGKGLLAADESTGTIQKRFDAIGVENTEANRQAYRQMLFDVSPEAHKYISGVILYEETLFQKTRDGVDFVKVLRDNGIVPGIKVDKGVKPLEGSVTQEPVTQGLDDLGARLQKYYAQGARFAKWRAVIDIHDGRGAPSELAIRLNCDLLARYASLCQANGIVPIVEPEVMVLEGDHSIDVSYDVTVHVLSQLYRSLNEQGVVLERTILKPNMVMPGKKHAQQADAAKVAEYTVRALRNTVPPAVPGIMFLSGGQSEDFAAHTLNEINKIVNARYPGLWPLTFSYGRALQESAQKAWSGKADNVKAGQQAYLQQSEKCYKAALGQL